MKKYNQPQTEIVSVELTNMIMSVSPGGPIHGIGTTPPPGGDVMH
jgi:hypothetical protein